MSTANSIKVDGLIRSIKTKGFTVPGAPKELTDNSLDASATIVGIDFDTANNALYIADDGDGMDRSKAQECYMFHADKPASDKTGLYGIGKLVAEGILCDLKSSTTTITRIAGGQIYEVTAPFAEGERTGTWIIYAHPVSVDGNQTWELRAINLGHGTVVRIPMQKPMFDKMIASIGDLARDYGFTYQDYLARGCQIRLSVDGVPVPIPADRALGYDAVAAHQRASRRIQIWKRGDEERIYHQDADGAMVRYNLSKSKSLDKNPFVDYVDVRVPDSGWEKVGDFTLLSVVNPEWNPEGESYVDGYMAYCRNHRYLAAHPLELAPGGDFEFRRLFLSSRHALKYTYREDAYILPEGNKSNVTKENIHSGLNKVVQTMIRSWVTNYYNEHVLAPAPVVDDGIVRPNKNQVKEFKDLFADEEWRLEYEALAARGRAARAARGE